MVAFFGHINYLVHEVVNSNVHMKSMVNYNKDINASASYVCVYLYVCMHACLSSSYLHRDMMHMRRIENLCIANIVLYRRVETILYLVPFFDHFNWKQKRVD